MDAVTTTEAVDKLLAELATSQVELSLDSGTLHVSAPKGVLTKELQVRLKEAKSAIVLRLAALQNENGEEPYVKADPLARNEPFALTDIQQAYWTGRTDLARHGSVMCHYYQEFESNELDFNRVETAFQKVVAKHDMLRAVIDADGRQHILSEVPFYKFGYDDMRGHSAEEAEASVAAAREQMAYEVFDCSQWPLFHIHAVQMDDRLRLHLSLDLIVIDAESLSKLIWDWKYYYDNPDADCAPLNFSFRDYVLTDQNRRNGEKYRNALSYWDSRLDNLPPAPALPEPRAEEGIESKTRVRNKSQLSATVWEQLKNQTRERSITASGFLCAIFAEVLAAWSREPQFCINLTFCDRRPIHPDVDAQLGDFTTNILLEADATAPRFIDRARAIQDRLHHDLDHIEVSGVEVLRRLNRRQHKQSLGVMPVVFTSLLGHGDSTPNVLFSSNWLGDAVYGISQTPQVSLDFQAYEADGALHLQWDSIAGAYPEGVLDAMFNAYCGLLERIGADETLWDAPYLVVLPKAQADVREEVNATDWATEEGLLLHQPFEHQAAIQPDALAVIGSDRTLSYTQLDTESLILAHDLIARGVVPGQHVAVVMEKGWEQVVAVLAILRAGAAYLPVDPALPKARLHHLLTNGEAALVLTQTRLAELLDWPDGVPVISVAAQSENSPRPEKLAPRAQPDSLAYTIFTSGSTGQPKGVMISHQGALNTVLDVNSRFGIGPQDRVLALSALNFDLSVYDIFGLLTAGGAIVLPPEGAIRDPGDWTVRIREYGITIWNTVPQLMRMLVEYHQGSAPETFDTLHTVMMSGDWISPDLPERITRIAPEAQLYSLGGATEASIWSIIYPINDSTSDMVSIPYGKAMANQSVHVLDAHLCPRPDWVEGEIYIGGRGLALGYWKNDDETAYRFVTSPKTGMRLYRTGDLGRALPDGNIEIIGRVDFQVKIQGHRIELGEIEQVLKRHEEVHEAVVEIRNHAGQTRLAAYVVPVDETDCELPARLLAHASAHLPRYMVPACVMEIEALPLSSNGKLDRARLPEPDWTAGNEIAANTENNSMTPRAQALLTAVETVLGQTGIGLEDNVFDLGGNSVQMVQINRNLRDVLGLELSVAEMFNHPTLASYACHLEQTMQNSSVAVTDRTYGADRRAALAQRRARSGTAAE